MTSSLRGQKGHFPLPVYFLIFLRFHKLVQITQISVSNAFRPLADYFLAFTWKATSVLSCTDFMVLSYGFAVQVNKLYTTAVWFIFTEHLSCQQALFRAGIFFEEERGTITNCNQQLHRLCTMAQVGRK